MHVALATGGEGVNWGQPYHALTALIIRKNKKHKKVLTIFIQHDIMLSINKKENEIMKASEIIKEAMKTNGWSQKTLAKQAGYIDKDGEGMQTAVSNRINGNTMRVDTFVKFLNTMGYELIVKSTNPNTNKNEWKVSE